MGRGPQNETDHPRLFDNSLGAARRCLRGRHESKSCGLLFSNSDDCAQPCASCAELIHSTSPANLISLTRESRQLFHMCKPPSPPQQFIVVTFHVSMFLLSLSSVCCAASKPPSCTNGPPPPPPPPLPPQTIVVYILLRNTVYLG